MNEKKHQNNKNKKMKLAITFFLILSLSYALGRRLKKTKLLKDDYPPYEVINKNAVYHIEQPIEANLTVVPFYYIQFIPISYCTDSQVELNQCCPAKDFRNGYQGWKRITMQELNISYDDIKIKKYLYLDKDYNFHVFVNDKYKKILFVFPGTRHILQLVEEAANQVGDKLISGITGRKDIDYIDNPSSKVISTDYFYNLYKLISPKVDQALSMVSQGRESYQYIFEGHSLGGVVATHAAYDYGKRKGNSMSPVLITYGSPKVGSKELVGRINEKVPIIYRVIRRGDFVPMTPPGSYHTKGLMVISKNKPYIYLCDDHMDNRHCKAEMSLRQSYHHRNYFEEAEVIFPNNCLLFQRNVSLS